MIKRILVALSGTPFTHTAIHHAVELARTHHAKVCGVTVTDINRLEDIGPVPVGGGAAAHDLTEHRMASAKESMQVSIDDFHAQCSEAGAASVLHMEEGDSLDQFMQLSRYNDLIVVGLRGLFEYGVVHNSRDLVLKAISKGLRPLLAVTEEPREINKVIIAYNGSMEAAKTMKHFARLHLWPNAEIRVICIGKNDDADQLLADAVDYLEEYGYTVDSEHRIGDAARVLLPAADEWGADLIVMGSTSRKKLGRLIWGDTALAVLEHSTVPVFLSQ